jgi:hypothetical protein
MDKNQALHNLLNCTASEEEIELLRQLLASGEISIGGDLVALNVNNGSTR